MKVNLIIEITNQWFKIVAYKDSFTSQKIVKVSVQPIPSEAFLEERTKILKNSLKRLNLKSQNIIFCLSRNQIMVRNFKFPSADAKEIDSVLSLQIEKEIPYSREESISAYQILSKTKDSDYIDVLSAIAQREVVKSLFNISKKANLYPERIELSSYGVLRWFSQRFPRQFSYQLNPAKFYLLLDIDQDFTDFIVFHRDELIFTRSIAQKAEAFLEEGAEREFADKIKHALIIFQAKEPQKKPARIFLSGAKLISQELVNFLEKELNLSVEAISHPTEICHSAGKIPEHISISAICGLATSKKENISFVLPEIETRRLLKTRVGELTLCGSLLLYFLLVVSGIFAVEVHKKERYLKELTNGYGQIALEIKALTEMQNTMKIVKQRLDIQGSALNCLYEIHRIIPDKITLKSINFRQNERLVLRGYGNAMSDIFNFVNILEGTPCFKNVETRYTTKKKLEGEEISEFEIVAAVEKEIGNWQ